MGGASACITWICTLEVCVRRSIEPGSPMSTQSVSHIDRAGCESGMLRASKLYQSVSISGPSATR